MGAVLRKEALFTYRRHSAEAHRSSTATVAALPRFRHLPRPPLPPACPVIPLRPVILMRVR
jgi:hypothetical protein